MNKIKTVLELQGRIWTLELERDDLELYGRRIYVRIEDVPVASKETANGLYEKIGDLLKVVRHDVSIFCTNSAHFTVSETNHRKVKQNVIV